MSDLSMALDMWADDWHIGLFQPPSDPNNRLWLRSDDPNIVLNSADIVTWPNLNLAYAARNVTQTTAALQMAYSASGGPGGLPYIEGDGVQEYLKGTWTQVQPTTTWIVAMPSVSDTAGNIATMDGGLQNSLRVHGGAPNTVVFFIGATQISVNAALNAWHVITAVASGATSTLTIDGTTNAGAIGAGDSDGLTLGATSNGGNNSDCRIAEVIQDTGVASTARRAAVEGYLAARYNL